MGEKKDMGYLRKGEVITEAVMRNLVYEDAGEREKSEDVTGFRGG